MAFWIVPLALVGGVFALPFGLLPGIVLFRDLANGVNVGHRRERAYERTVWCGLLGAYALAVALLASVLHLAFA